MFKLFCRAGLIGLCICCAQPWVSAIHGWATPAIEGTPGLGDACSFVVAGLRNIWIVGGLLASLATAIGLLAGTILGYVGYALVNMIELGRVKSVPNWARVMVYAIDVVLSYRATVPYGGELWDFWNDMVANTVTPELFHPDRIAAFVVAVAGVEVVVAVVGPVMAWSGIQDRNWIGQPQRPRQNHQSQQPRQNHQSQQPRQNHQSQQPQQRPPFNTGRPPAGF